MAVVGYQPRTTPAKRCKCRRKLGCDAVSLGVGTVYRLMSKAKPKNTRIACGIRINKKKTCTGTFGSHYHIRILTLSRYCQYNFSFLLYYFFLQHCTLIIFCLSRQSVYLSKNSQTGNWTVTQYASYFDNEASHVVQLVSNWRSLFTA